MRSRRQGSWRWSSSGTQWLLLLSLLLVLLLLLSLQLLLSFHLEKDQLIMVELFVQVRDKCREIFLPSFPSKLRRRGNSLRGISYRYRYLL